MEKLSRVKKYEDLRKSIETDNTVNDPTRDAMGQEQQDALKKFDSSILKKANIEDAQPYVPEREKSMEKAQDKSEIEDTFTNEYLDDFIREVRDYNIQKGNRVSEDTQVDILSQLNATNRAKRAHYVEDIKEDNEESDKVVVSSDDIAKEVANLINEEPSMMENDVDEEDPYATTEILLDKEKTPVVEETVEETVEEKTQVLQEEPVAKKILQPSYDMSDTDLYDTQNIPESENEEEQAQIHQKLMEETQQLRVQMDEYEDELTDLSDDMEKNNKVLNIILCFLILVLLAIIGFIGFYIWKGGNF